ncbi:MAG: Tryptophan synthase beta chain [Chlamydiales bacterium]|nr:Tryptophan synthase beta chain [Chlamydiales bacterium]
MSLGRYGPFGGQYVPEILVQPLKELEQGFLKLVEEGFLESFHAQLAEYGGRPTPLTEVPRFAQAIQGPRIFLKREDLLHTGAHKLNNALGQCLLAKHLGKTRVICETGAGQHGVATASACARLGLECVVYMGALDVQRQEPNVKRIKLLGAEVIAVDQGGGILKDAINEALRDWSASFEKTHYCLGSALGPHPFPEMVKTFQLVIGTETQEQIHQRIGRDPDYLVACVGGGSNAIGFFTPFLSFKRIQMIGVEAGGMDETEGLHAARFSSQKKGVLHGCYTYLLQDEGGQVQATHSVSAGLDYPAIGPEHAYLFESKRVEYVSVRDQQAIEAMLLLSKTEGIIPALESSHALAYLVEVGNTLPSDAVIILNLSGRGDKDLPQLFSILGEKNGTT